MVDFLQLQNSGIDHDFIAKPMPVVICEPTDLSAEVIVDLEKFGPVRLGPFTTDELILAVSDAGVLMVRLHHMINQDVFEAAPQLKIIISATTGLTHIDLDACYEHQVSLVCTRGERAFLSTITGTAELALCLLLSLSRHVPEAQSDVKRGNWRRDLFRGKSLHGQRLGILGLGRLGFLIAEFAQALGMAVQACDPNPMIVPPYVELVDLRTLMHTSDAISIHASYRPGDPPIIGRQELSTCNPELIIINTARGELVEEQAIIDAIQAEVLGGYGTDVLSGQPGPDPVSGHPLVLRAQTDPRVMILPHIGGSTVDGLHRAEVFVVSKALKKAGLR